MANSHALPVFPELPGGVSRSFLGTTLLLLTVGFFLAEHDVQVSQREAYTQNQEQMESAAGGGSVLRRAVFLMIAGVGAYGWATLPRGRFAWDGPLVLVGCAFLSWCTASLLWSDDPGMTLRRLMVVYCFALGALGIGARLRSGDLLWLALGISTILLGVGVMSELALGTFRPWSSEYRFSGSLHPNIQGLNLATMTLAAFALFRESPRQRGWLLALFACGFLFLILTKSRTSCAALLLALGLVGMLRSGGEWQLPAAAGLLGMLFLCGVIALLAGFDLDSELERAALLGREEQAESLTGRLPIWNELVPFVNERPWCGYGYDSFWSPRHIDLISTELQWGIREAHSAYLDTILSTGLIGLGLLLSTVLLGLGKAASRYMRQGDSTAGFLCGLLLFALVNSGTESIMQMPLCVPFLACCGLVQLSLRAEENLNSVTLPESAVVPRDAAEDVALEELVRVYP